MSYRLIITYLYADNPRPPRSVTTEEPFSSDSWALDRADELINREKKRLKKDRYQGPVLTDLRLECDDGTVMKYDEIKRVAPAAVRD
jgi:hypothetical protein